MVRTGLLRTAFVTLAFVTLLTGCAGGTGANPSDGGGSASERCEGLVSLDASSEDVTATAELPEAIDGDFPRPPDCIILSPDEGRSDKYEVMWWNPSDTEREQLLDVIGTQLTANGYSLIFENSNGTGLWSLESSPKSFMTEMRSDYFEVESDG